MPAFTPRLAFIDIEASGLRAGSYPVEVGWAIPFQTESGRWEVHNGSLLIRPVDDWLKGGGWDHVAQLMHGISQEQLLTEGHDPRDAAEQLDLYLSRTEVVSDTGPTGLDAAWLKEIYAEAEMALPRLWQMSSHDAGQMVGLALAGGGLATDWARHMLERHAPLHTHAAGEDAYRLAWMWAAAMALRDEPVARLPLEKQRRLPTDLSLHLPTRRWPQRTHSSRYRPRRAKPRF